MVALIPFLINGCPLKGILPHSISSAAFNGLIILGRCFGTSGLTVVVVVVVVVVLVIFLKTPHICLPLNRIASISGTFVASNLTKIFTINVSSFFNNLSSSLNVNNMLSLEID